MTLMTGDLCPNAQISARLRRVVNKELESLILSKEHYDADFPEHAKFLTKDDLWRMSYNKALEKLCMPPSEESDTNFPTRVIATVAKRSRGNAR